MMQKILVQFFFNFVQFSWKGDWTQQ